MSSKAADAAADDDTAVAESNDMDYESRCRAKLPSPEELSAMIWGDGDRQIDPSRQLHIYTWGDHLMKASALKTRGSQWNINAKPLNGRGGGANVHKNALQVGSDHQRVWGMGSTHKLF